MRDFKGIPFASLPEPSAPDFSPRLRNMFSAIDAWARDVSAAVGLLKDGRIPSGSGATLGGAGDAAALDQAPFIRSVDPTDEDTGGFVTLATDQTVIGNKAFTNFATIAPTLFVGGIGFTDTVRLIVTGATAGVQALQEWIKAGPVIVATMDKDGNLSCQSFFSTGNSTFLNGGTTVPSLTVETANSGASFNAPSGLGLVLNDNGGFLGEFTSVGLTANRAWALPDATGIIVVQGTTATLTLSATSALITSTASSGVAFQDTTTSSKKLRHVLSGAVGNNSFTVANTAARDYKFEDVPGTVDVVGNGADPPASGAMGKVNRTAQSAAVAATNLTNSTPAGYYVVHYTLEITTTDAGAATIQFQISYTDDIGATTQVGAAIADSANNRDRGTFEVYLASGNVTYQTNLVGAIGSGRYALRVRIEFLG